MLWEGVDLIPCDPKPIQRSHFAAFHYPQLRRCASNYPTIYSKPATPHPPLPTRLIESPRLPDQGATGHPYDAVGVRELMG
ncbi:Rho guanyl nucleotide exchange factor, putative [Isosphaera pallida ATCC 43644]|uniref:Rho guanyl nucleotide exchange factor, putative n=1 Tax=Isosphaera pallida (strain ATCC 43644 / DSM 9630 / IS1B) TaxID=575540 RepID=E8R275_ISOPI|nr:Rho guanyl nucleotide exchange factor, putative [Isosphaera pallida ATCC 43644]